jgi:hypothetical protein
MHLVVLQTYLDALPASVVETSDERGKKLLMSMMCDTATASTVVVKSRGCFHLQVCRFGINSENMLIRTNNKYFPCCKIKCLLNIALYLICGYCSFLASASNRFLS